MRFLRMRVTSSTPFDPQPAIDSQRFIRIVCWCLLALIGGAFCLLAAPALRYPRYFSMPGAVGYLVAPIVVLVLYALVIWRLPLLAARVPEIGSIVRLGAI